MNGVLNFFYRLYNGYELVAILMSGLGALAAGIAAIKQKKESYNKKESHNIEIYLILAVLIILLILSIISGAIRYHYTETPDIIGDTLHNAHRSLRNSDLVFDDVTEQMFELNLGTSNFVVQTQEPKSGEIVRKNSVVTVTIVEITNSSEATDASSIQDPDDTDTSSISTPTQDITNPTPPAPTQDITDPTPPAPSIVEPTPTSNSSSTPNNGTDTESGTDTGDPQPVRPPASNSITKDPCLDSSFNGNASVGGGANSDDGPGDLQPQDPSERNSSEQEVINNGTISVPW